MDNHSEDLHTLYRYTVGNVIANRADKRAQQATKQYKNRDERFCDKAKIEMFIFKTSNLHSYYCQIVHWGFCSLSAVGEREINCMSA